MGKECKEAYFLIAEAKYAAGEFQYILTNVGGKFWRLWKGQQSGWISRRKISQVCSFPVWLSVNLRTMITQWVRSALNGVDIRFRYADKNSDLFSVCSLISLPFRYKNKKDDRLPSSHSMRRSRWQIGVWMLWNMWLFLDSSWSISISNRNLTSRLVRISSGWRKCWIIRRSTGRKKNQSRPKIWVWTLLMRPARTCWMTWMRILSFDLASQVIAYR